MEKVTDKLNILWRYRGIKAMLIAVAVLVSFDLVFPLKTNIAYAPILTASDGSMLHSFLSRDDKWRMYTELEEITPILRKAILFKEDNYFYYHPGFNPVSLLRAFGRNSLTGRRTSGASTITMQVVRLLEPRKRTYFSKLIELVRAVQLELHYSKDEILQLYLNLIPYGSNIEGLKAASWLYFGKPPKLLSLAEITTLTIIPNRPSSLRLGRRNAYVIEERNRWLNRFRKAGLFEAEAIDDAISEPLSAYRRQAPQLAPHLSLRLRQEKPDEPIIQTTLRPAMQASVEQLVQNYVNRVRTFNIQNAAVLVVDNQTMEVVAYVGSADFRNVYDGGQVDGVRAVRSPGSTLKPLLYAMAFDAGLITPKSKLNDVPINVAGYEPENYDRRFNGPVTAEFALANSLNIPAVKLLKEIGTSTFVSTLQKAGFTTIRKQASDLGLSMILGGCGVTLEEMTRLYATMANGGEVRVLNLTPLPPLQRERGSIFSFFERDSIAKLPLSRWRGGRGGRLISSDAAFLVTNTLTQITRPDLPNNFDNSYHLPRIAWKTGTSYGRRDAWSIGYNQRFTVGVWVGNFSGVGVAELSGANTATPLLFQLFNAIDYNSPSGWFKAPKGSLAVRQVCPESGDIPADFCQARAVDYYIMGISKTQHCQHLKKVFTNTAGTISYCAHCLPDSGYVQRDFPNLAPEVIAHYENRRIPYAKIPVHNPACERVFDAGQQANAPLIVSPNDRSEYYIDAANPVEVQLACQAANDVRVIYWYLNDKLYRKASPTEAVFFKPRPGDWKISCADDRGRSTDIRILVKRQ